MLRLFLLALLLLAAPLRAQSPAGLWLIAPESHDDLIESGVLLTHYPVLAIDAGGTFRLQFVTVACHPLGPDGALLMENEDAACERQAEVLRGDLGGAMGYRTMAGRWTIDGRRIRFAPQPAGPVPAEEARRLIETPLDEVPPGRRPVFPRLAATFHTTWHVGDGATMGWQRSGNRLVLTPPTGAPLAWIETTAATIATTQLTIMALEISGATYFRCVFAAARRAQAGDDPNRMIPLAAMTLKLRRNLAAMNAAPPTDATLPGLIAEMNVLAQDLRAHPLTRAVAEDRLDAALGCAAVR